MKMSDGQIWLQALIANTDTELPKKLMIILLIMIVEKKKERLNL